MEHFFACIFSDEEALVASKRPFGKEKDLGWSAGVIISSNQCTLFVYQEESGFHLLGGAGGKLPPQTV